MLAAPAVEPPAAVRLPGGVVFEPKFDGWRGLLHRTDAGSRVVSRHGTDLTACFPDLVAAACTQLRPGTVLDGELVVWRHGRVDFTALAERMAGARRCAQLAKAWPATLMVFDVLAADGVDVRSRRLEVRRALVEELAARWVPPLQLVPQTDDADVATGWLADYAAGDVGVEGLVAKGRGQAYRGGVRGWRKIRIRHTREAVVGGVLGSPRAPRALVLGLPGTSGRLRVAGVTLPLSRKDAAVVAAQVRPATGAHPWPESLTWSGFGDDPVPVVRVEGGLVVEVSADTAFERGRWRHPTRFVRCRPDLAGVDLPRVPAHA